MAYFMVLGAFYMVKRIFAGDDQGFISSIICQSSVFLSITFHDNLSLRRSSSTSETFYSI